MLFYIPAPRTKGFTANQGGKRFILSTARLIVAIFLIASLFVSAFFAHSHQWNEGTTVLLHMAEVTFGGVFGLLFGEAAAQRELDDQKFRYEE